MKLPAIAATLLALVVVLPLGSRALAAGQLSYHTNTRWASLRDLTDAEFADAYKDYRARGFIMIDVDGYATPAGVRYAMVWETNADGRDWAEYRDLDAEKFHDTWTAQRDQGFRLTDISAYPVGSELKWAGIWVRNKEGVKWGSFRGDSSDEYGKRFKDQTAAGYRVVDLDIYRTPQGIRYASIWVEDKDHRNPIERRDMTRERYQQEIDANSKDGWTVVDFESYETQGGQRYAAIWEKVPGLSSQTRTDRTELEFANLWRQYGDEGYRLLDFERYDTASGPRYAGLWLENDSRFRYDRKQQLDKIVADYSAANRLPGISVAVIRNGDVLYERGVGFADVAGRKVAFSGTVYCAASVSKVIGGTLAAKLESEQKLRDGTTFKLDLSKPTSSYIGTLPDADGSGTVTLPSPHKAHTVEQLLSHLGCVPHYPSATTPGIANQTTHYVSAADAVQSIWNTGLVTKTKSGGPCTVGSTYSYSTAAFTFVGAVLERATGRTIAQLLDRELFSPYQLGMRVQFAERTLPANYDRAVPYETDNSATTYGDNSWKVLGGGIETSALEVARFGWKVLHGEIVPASVRDNRLWKRVNANAPHGLAWAVNNDPKGRRTAEWNGAATGARSYLRAYRDDGLVIAVMSNRDEHSVQDLGGLSDDLGNAVLAK